MELGFKCPYCGIKFTMEHNKLFDIGCPKCLRNLSGSDVERVFDYESNGAKFYNKRIKKYEFINA